MSKNDKSEGEKNGRERNRGRQAETPGEIPSAGWKDVVRRVKNEISADNLSIVAAGVAFYAFLAIFPAVAAFVSVYGLLVSPSGVESDLAKIESVLPSQTADMVNGQVRRIVKRQQSQLGWALVVSVALALWSAAKGTKAMIQAMNVTYDEEENRSFLKLNLTAVLLTVGALALGVVCFVVIGLLPVLFGSMGLGHTVAVIVRYARWPILAALGVFAVGVLYRFGPDRDQAQWKWVSWGAVIGTLLWLVGSALFSVYVTHFGSYDKTYGSLGAVAVLMMWFWLSTFAILLGSEVNAEMEHQTTKDTTVGKPKPRGDREAYVADTVGQSQH